MAAKGEARAKISLDYSSWEKGAKFVTASAATMISTAAAVGTAMAAAAVVGVAAFAYAARAGVADVLKMGESLANMAHATGMAAGQFAAFKLMLEHGISFSDAGEMLGRNAALLSKDAAIFRDVQIKIAESGIRIQGFWIGFADKIAPVMNVFLDKFNAIDLTKWGQDFAEPIANTIKVLYEFFSNGQLWEVFALGMKSAIYESFSAFRDIAVQFALVFYNAIATAVTAIESKVEGFLRNPFAAVGNLQNDFKEIAGQIITSALSFGNSFTGATEEFKNKISQALSQFGGEESSSKHFDNRSAVQNFGVSNLQKLGLGGTVGGIQDSIGQQSLVVQRDALQALNKIATLLIPKTLGNATGVPAPAWFDTTTMEVSFN